MSTESEFLKSLVYSKGKSTKLFPCFLIFALFSCIIILIRYITTIQPCV